MCVKSTSIAVPAETEFGTEGSGVVNVSVARPVLGKCHVFHKTVNINKRHLRH